MLGVKNFMSEICAHFLAISKINENAHEKLFLLKVKKSIYNCIFFFRIKMLEERCFICGSRIGRGMHPSLGHHEKMEKLVSVTQSVAHSNTIICDTLSRILNETVMEDESICKICFNLLSDIDYHLKEAQVSSDLLVVIYRDAF